METPLVQLLKIHLLNTERIDSFKRFSLKDFPKDLSYQSFLLLHDSAKQASYSNAYVRLLKATRRA